MSQSAELITLLTALVGCESYSGKEHNVQRLIADWFSLRGMPVQYQAAADGLQNVVVEIAGHDEGPTLWIGGHCDTVAIADGWQRQPHQPVIEGDRLYGLGAMDMKAGLAAAMITVHQLFQQREQWGGRVIFAALADEEAWSRGADAFVCAERHIDAAIMCEPHFNDIVIGAMGKINIDVTVKGRAAHGSTPEKGVNAVTEAARLLVAIDQIQREPHPQFGPASHCVLNVSSGNAPYQISVPDFCTFRLNWQFMPGESAEQALQLLRQCAADLHSAATFTVSPARPHYESYLLADDEPALQLLLSSYRAITGKQPELRFGKGVSDANIFCGRAGIPTYLFGPGGANMHAGDEWVDLPQLALTQQIYLHFAQRFLHSLT